MTDFYYVDTSALNRRYLDEIGSSWIRKLTDPSTGNAIMVSELTAVEGFSTYARLYREARLTSIQLEQLQSTLLWHMENEYLVIPIYRTMLILARELLNRHPLRTLDAIQLASARLAADRLPTSVTFLTADKVLFRAALAEGFDVDDPISHA